MPVTARPVTLPQPILLAPLPGANGGASPDRPTVALPTMETLTMRDVPVPALPGELPGAALTQAEEPGPTLLAGKGVVIAVALAALGFLLMRRR